MASGDRIPGKPGMIEAPVRLAVRPDEERGVIVAWLAPNDGSLPGSAGWVEVSTLSIAVADLHPDVYRAWLACMELTVEHATRQCLKHFLGRPVDLPAGQVLRRRHPDPDHN